MRVGGGGVYENFGVKIFKNRFTPLIWKFLMQNNTLNRVFCTKNKITPLNLVKLGQNNASLLGMKNSQVCFIYTPVECASENALSPSCLPLKKGIDN